MSRTFKIITGISIFYQNVTYDSKILSRKITRRTKFYKDGFGTYVGVGWGGMRLSYKAWV